MPWTAASFKKKHNHGMSMPVAKKAAEMATAMVKSGVPEGEAIATANKRAASAARKAKKRG